MAKKQKDPLQEFVEKAWPKTKQELEKAAENAKKMLAKGESYLKEVSDKGIEKTKKMTLSIRKEKLYYDLGKAVSSAGLTKISSNKKISKVLREIKKLDSQIKKIK
jgi:vacuolar-type H+-ATPase subunit H